MDKVAYGHGFQPLVDGAPALELFEAAGLVFHEVEVKLVDKFIVIDRIGEYQAYDLLEKRSAVLKKELLRDAFVPVNQ